MKQPAYLLLLILLVALAMACQSRRAQKLSAGVSSRSAASLQPSASAVRVASTPSGPHDPSNPPIDCPLRKQGIDPTALRPFEDTEKYIEFLERADRASWQKPEEIVRALGLTGSETVVDVGAGSGYFAFRFARALPAGKVVAADTEAEMIRHLHHQSMQQGVRNLQATLIPPADPRIPAEADWVFICDVLHHVADRGAWLTKLASEMKPGARLALIEFKEGKLPEGPPETVKIPRAELIALAVKAGLSLNSEQSFLPYQWFLVFDKP